MNFGKILRCGIFFAKQLIAWSGLVYAVFMVASAIRRMVMMLGVSAQYLFDPFWILPDSWTEFLDSLLVDSLFLFRLF